MLRVKKSSLYFGCQIFDFLTRNKVSINFEVFKRKKKIAMISPSKKINVLELQFNALDRELKQVMGKCQFVPDLNLTEKKEWRERKTS